MTDTSGIVEIHANWSAVDKTDLSLCFFLQTKYLVLKLEYVQLNLQRKSMDLNFSIELPDDLSPSFCEIM